MSLRLLDDPQVQQKIFTLLRHRLGQIHKGEIATALDGGGPMEPPIGYGATYRSIFLESQFGTVTR